VPVETRLQLVLAVLSHGVTVAEAARRHGVSMESINRWRNRFVDAGKVEGGTPERQSVSFEEGGKRVVFELRSGSVRNPMRLAELAQFRCPG